MRQVMPYHIFNTHEYIKALIKAGMQENLAEILIKGILESRECDFSKLATKENLEVLKISTKEQIDSLRHEVKANTAELRTELKSEIAGLRTEFAELRTEFAEFRTELKGDNAMLRTEFAELKATVSDMQANIFKSLLPLFLTLIGLIAAVVLKMFLVH